MRWASSLKFSAALEHALDSGALEPEQQFWAYDGLIFAALKHGVREQADKVSEWLSASERIVEQFGLSPTFRARLWMKRMGFAGVLGDKDGVMAALEQASRDMPDLKGHQRILAYNAAAALFSIGSYRVAKAVVSVVIKEYYDVLDIAPEQVVGLKQPELWKAINTPSLNIEDVKHLADRARTFGENWQGDRAESAASAKPRHAILRALRGPRFLCPGRSRCSR